MRRILVEGINVGAHQIIGTEIGQLLADVRLGGLENRHHRFVGVDDVAVRVSNHHAGADVVERDLDPRHLVGSTLGLGHFEAHARLHRLQRLQRLAGFVVARDVNAAGIVPLRDARGCIDNEVERTFDGTHQIDAPHHREQGKQRQGNQGGLLAALIVCRAHRTIFAGVVFHVLEEVIQPRNRLVVGRPQLEQDDLVGLDKFARQQRFARGQQPFLDITPTGVGERGRQFFLLILVQGLLDLFPECGNQGDVFLDIISMDLQRMVVHLGKRHGRIMLQPKQQLATIFRHQTTDTPHLFNRHDMLAEHCANITFRVAPGTQHIAEQDRHDDRQYRQNGTDLRGNADILEDARTADNLTIANLQIPLLLFEKLAIHRIDLCHHRRVRLAAH